MGKHPNDRLQGTLDLLVLKSLASRGTMHGYGITVHIQQVAGDILRVEEEMEAFLFDFDRSCCIGQDLDRITLFEVRLTYFRGGRLAGELPVWRWIADKRIRKRLACFVRQCGHVLESGAKEARGNPARVLGDPAGLRKGAVSEIGVKPERATLTRNIGIGRVQRKQKRVWK